MSLRRFIEDLPGDEKIYVDRVLNPDLEPTKVLHKADMDGKAVIFRVSTSNFICVGNVLNNRYRLYKRVLNVDNDIDAYRKLLEASSRVVKPVEKAFENHYTQIKDFDLEKLPFIKFFPEDGGRYLSSSIFISCIEDICNASVHRTMLVSRNTVVARIVPRHLRYIYDRYIEKGEEAPVAIVVGAHPAVILMASSSPPLGVFELYLVPNILKEFSIVYTPLYRLPVPSSAAIVMEGRIKRETHSEGPFVDLLHLYDSIRSEPLIKIDSVYVNMDELFHVILPAGREHKLLQSFYREALVWDSVSKVVPKVHKVRFLESGGSWIVVGVSIDKAHDADGKNAILAAFAAHPSAKIVLVVDSDIDLDSDHMILWALATRYRGRDSMVLIDKARCSTLDPSSPDGVCDKLGLDLTIPMKSDRKRYRYVRVE